MLNLQMYVKTANYYRALIIILFLYDPVLAQNAHILYICVLI